MFTTQHSQERFYDPSEGTVCLDGVSVSAHDLAWLRRSIGVVSQDPTMFAGTVAENIAYARPHASRAEVEAARGQSQQAIDRLRGVVERLPLPGYVISLAELELATGRSAAADEHLEFARAEERRHIASG